MGKEVDEFLAATTSRFNEAEIALHNGDAGPRIAMWSHNEPVTVFGAAASVSGWTEIGPLFERLGSSFSNCTAYDNEGFGNRNRAGTAIGIDLDRITWSSLSDVKLAQRQRVSAELFDAVAGLKADGRWQER